MNSFKQYLEEKLLSSLALAGGIASSVYAGSATKPEALEIATNHIKNFEGFVDVAKPDKIAKGNPLTVGYGMTYNYPDGTPIKLGDRVSREEAHNHMKQHIDNHIIPHMEKIPGWNEMDANKQAALIGFSYNTGGAFYGTKNYKTISTHLKNKDWDKVDDAMHLYNKSAGEVRAGLVRRRKMEADLWNSTPQPTQASKPKASSEITHHVVSPGDNLTKIAKKYSTTVDELLNKNPHLKSNPNSISVDQKIRIK